MKFKKLLAAILCAVLSLLVFVCGCDLFLDSAASDSSGIKPSVQPEDDDDGEPEEGGEEEDDDGDGEGKQPAPAPDTDPDGTDKETSDGIGSDGYLIADGQHVKNRNGDTVYLRGVNAGGLFVTEHWMTGFTDGATASDDYKSLTRTFIERFGEEKTKELWAEYRANWWSETDFKNCADMGMNVIRLPFTYMNVDFGAITDYANAGDYDFTALDEFVSKAAEYGMYTILDLHGAYGSQNGQDHSGECKDYGEVDFYSNVQMQTLTVNLWSALSEHYKDNPAVAGYDILNEPGEKAGATEERHWQFYDKVYDAIRENNDEHIVIFESCWDWWNLPRTSVYGWENCIYSFHHYVADNLTAEEHIGNWQDKLSGVSDAGFGLPLQMGEFTAYGSAEKWEQTLDLMNKNGWHYTSWTYKVWGTSPWGIVNVIGEDSDKVNAATDSYEKILSKFSKLRTENAQYYSFGDSGRTLRGIFKEYLTGLNTDVIINKIGLIEDNGKAYAVFSGLCGDCTKEELASYVIDAEVNGRIKLNTVVSQVNYDNGTFIMKADISGLANGSYYMHAGFENSPPNLSASLAQIDAANTSVSAGGKTYSLGEAWGCRQIIVR